MRVSQLQLPEKMFSAQPFLLTPAIPGEKSDFRK